MLLNACCVLLLVSGTYSGVIRLKSGSHSVKLGKDIRMSSMPDTMDMEVPVGDTMAAMKLIRSDTVTSDIPVFLGTDEDAFVLWNSDNMDDFVVYEDPGRQASFVLWTNEKDAVSGHGMMGVFDNGIDTYSMEPMDPRQVSRQTRYFGDEYEPVMVTMNGAKLSLTKVNRSELSNSEAEQMLSDETMILQQQIQEFMFQHAQGSINKMTYEVELLVVVDYSVFQKWLSRSRSMDYKIKEAQAINFIRYYFANVINGVGLRYKKVTENGNRILVRPVAIYIAKSANASPWSELAPIKQEYHFNEAHDSLDEFERWANDKQKVFLSFDQAMAFTNNDLFSGYVDGRRYVINGLSNMMGICGQKRFSLSHDGGQFASIQTGAHELGHSFGAYHDSYGNGCSKRGKYIMTDSSNALNSDNTDQSSQFSSCSKRAFWDFLYYLTANKSNCLVERNNYNANWDSTMYEQHFLGQRYTADEQCMIAHGISSFHCDGDGNIDDTLCSKLYCWVAINGMCEAFDDLSAVDGTPCGNKQWCMGGNCVKDPEAPKYEGSPCSHGANAQINDYECFDIAVKEPHKCYDSNFRSACCETCSLLLRDGKADEGCEYGNKDPIFCQQNFIPTDCYLDSDTCCDTCRRYRINETDCEYGDKSMDCDKAHEVPSMCYATNTTCCSTCPRLQVGVKGCEWGNKIERCHTFSKEDCYDPKFAIDCCDYCSQEKDGPVGCEWGDMISSCTQSNCSGANAKKCCNTCSATTTTTTTQPTTTSTAEEPFLADQIAFDAINTDEVQEICEDKDPHCSEIRGGHDCYRATSDCCKTCLPYETDDPMCAYGDRMSWCARYVAEEGKRVCEDPYIENECCATCSTDRDDKSADSLSLCSDAADWCKHIFPGQCYQVSTRKTCCARCSSMERREANCLYGDAYSWCDTKYCRNSWKECCQTCRKPIVLL